METDQRTSGHAASSSFALNQHKKQMTIDGIQYPDAKCITNYQTPKEDIYDSFQPEKDPQIEAFSKNNNWNILWIILLLAIIWIFIYQSCK